MSFAFAFMGEFTYRLFKTRELRYSLVIGIHKSVGLEVLKTYRDFSANVEGCTWRKMYLLHSVRFIEQAAFGGKLRFVPFRIKKIFNDYAVGPLLPIVI